MKSEFIKWSEIISIEVRHFTTNGWRKRSYPALEISGEAKQVDILVSSIKSLRRKFIKFCPRRDLVERAENILDKGYISKHLPH